MVALSKREIFLGYVRHGGEKFFSPQIGAGAGFDTKLAGKEWISETTLEDTLAALERFDLIPLINVGCPLDLCLPDLPWRERIVEESTERITREYLLETPVGCLVRRSCESKRSGSFDLRYAVAEEKDLDPFAYYLDRLLAADYTPILDYTRGVVAKIDAGGALSVQWPVQPYELLCFPNTVDTVMLAHDCPERFQQLMERIVRIDRKLMGAVALGGADFIFLGAPGPEMLSPSYYERYIIPYSEIVTEFAHSYGLMVYSHICSPVEPFLTMGFYNRMGIDLFETLSPPPVGNITSLGDALSKLDPRICTRGNLGLDVLLHASTTEIKDKTKAILEAAGERKHIIAASDYLFYDIPEENVQAMAEAVGEWRGKKTL